MDSDRPYTVDEVRGLRQATGAPIRLVIRFLTDTPEPLRSRVLQAITDRETSGATGFLRDPVETDLATRTTFEQVSAEVRHDLPHSPDFVGRMGNFGRVCFEIQRRLREDHGIIWFTPTEMNPWTIFN